MNGNTYQDTVLWNKHTEGDSSSGSTGLTSTSVDPDLQPKWLPTLLSRCELQRMLPFLFCSLVTPSLTASGSSPHDCWLPTTKKGWKAEYQSFNWWTHIIVDGKCQYLSPSSHLALSFAMIVMILPCPKVLCSFLFPGFKYHCHNTIFKHGTWHWTVFLVLFILY